MEYLIIFIIGTAILVTMALIIEFGFKKVKNVAENKELDEISKEFPDNIDIANVILKKLDNKDVIVEENKESKTCLYIVVSNKILIANIRDSFTRVQTIAHECIHSIQNKKLLWTNFIFSNIYIIYTILLLILTMFKILKPSMVQVAVLLLFGMVQYFIRDMLEMEAMIKARYVAKEYLEESDVCSKEICNRIIQEYDKLNAIGIKMVNYDIFVRNIAKVLLYCVICGVCMII